MIGYALDSSGFPGGGVIVTTDLAVVSFGKFLLLTVSVLKLFIDPFGLNALDHAIGWVYTSYSSILISGPPYYIHVVAL